MMIFCIFARMESKYSAESNIMREVSERLSANLDYSVLDRHRTVLNQLTMLHNSYITVFDHATNSHVLSFFGENNILGYEIELNEGGDSMYHEVQIHPSDFDVVFKGRIATMNFLLSLPDKKEIFNYKLVNEYRALHSKGVYIRVIEQFQLLELDVHDNLWLSLSVLDIAPDQSSDLAKSQVINYRSGAIFSPPLSAGKSPVLSSRELEILQMVKQGFYSKEISERLSISIHTVNTHRQHILAKLGADNSIEAVKFASRLGLV